jgi:endonuclease G
MHSLHWYVLFGVACGTLLQYQQFQLEHNCPDRTAQRFYYKLSYDTGSASRPSSFYTDPKYSKQCQQFSTSAYGSGYDRGHLVASNHMDMNSQTIRESHYMTNIVPQASRFNQGIWVETERITDCYRDLAPISVYGGVVYSDPSNDYFVKSHGIKTPEYFWKVLVTTSSSGQEKSIAWFIPNVSQTSALETYIVSIDYIESKLNDNLGRIPVSASLKSQKGDKSLWAIPNSCRNSSG